MQYPIQWEGLRLGEAVVVVVGEREPAAAGAVHLAPGPGRSLGPIGNELDDSVAVVLEFLVAQQRSGHLVDDAECGEPGQQLALADLVSDGTQAPVKTRRLRTVNPAPIVELENGPGSPQKAETNRAGDARPANTAPSGSLPAKGLALTPPPSPTKGLRMPHLDTRIDSSPTDASQGAIGNRDQPLLAEAERLAALLKANAAETRRRRRLPDEITAALRTTGFLTLLAPRRHGGHAADLNEVFEVFATLAHGCAPSAWGFLILSGSALVAALSSSRTRAEVRRNASCRPSAPWTEAGRVT